MLNCDRSAQNEALMALDFVSLLISKDLPRQADLTMSPFLKQAIKPGILGTDLWQDMEPDGEKEATDALLTKGWKLQSLQQSADSLLKAATRLESNVKQETEYWNEVLSVSERGWSVCRMPRERHHLGVRYGFSEAQGEFRNRGLAALRADSDRHVVLDRGFGNNPKAIRVRVRHDSKIVGTSRMPVIGNESELTTEARIRHARDSLYEEELFQEMTRESRSLASYGVRMKGNTIGLPTTHHVGHATSADSTIIIDLVPLSDTPTSDNNQETEDQLPQAVALISRLLLSYTHRERLKQRSQVPPPLSMKTPEPPTAPILRPILAFLSHQSALKSLDAYLERIKSLLTAASITYTATPARFSADVFSSTDTIHSLVSTIVAPLRTTCLLNLSTPELTTEHEFRIDVETAIAAPLFGTKYILTTAPTTEPRRSSDFSVLVDLAELMDAVIANALASGIAVRMPGSVLDERCAVVRRKGAGRAADVRVVLTSGIRGLEKGDEAVLKMDYDKLSERWTRGESSKTFWEAVDEIAARGP